MMVWSQLDGPHFVCQSLKQCDGTRPGVLRCNLFQCTTAPMWSTCVVCYSTCPFLCPLLPSPSPPPSSGVFLLPPSVTAEDEPNDSFFSLHLYEDQTPVQPDMTPSPDYPMDMLQTAALFPPISPSPEAGPPLHLTEVELTTTSDHTYPPLPPVGDPFQMEPTPPSPATEPPQDFLDLLDTMQQGNVGDDPPNFPFPRAPGAKWLPTPERPPMFRQKLY